MNLDTEPGSLNKKEGRRFHLLLSKRLHLLPPFLSNESCTGLTFPSMLVFRNFWNNQIIERRENEKAHRGKENNLRNFKRC
jgi:hypothetical protein